MHIPENYLSPETCAVMGVIMLPIWYKAVKTVEVKVKEDKETIPMLGISTSLSFLIMMFNLPVPGGTTAHAVGAVLIAILLGGPWAATLSISIALAMQALLFGDGGILAFGANCFTMGVLMPFSGYAIFKLLRGKSQKHNTLASFLGGYFGINIAALGVAILLGIQPILFKDSSGNPLYNPYPLSVTIPMMGITHLIVGFVEGFFTAGVYQFVKRIQKPLDEFSERKPFWTRFKPLIILIVLLIILTPLGLLASGSAFAEWDVSEIFANLSKYHLTPAVPKGMTHGFSFSSLMTDYSISGLPDSVGYILSAVTAVLISFLLYRLLFGRRANK
ncbi:cobalt transporter CbiM [Lactococcus lactis]|uniref:cobalt transporter CbiM n=1 Tax=Lactococcus lactis TaxID=1358 RepID=UPI00117A47BE|nr:cobalt transporter CbiM [Lactococcus lactis]TRW74413.1 cobalt transporter CbiM [Lactococcus lactis]